MIRDPFTLGERTIQFSKNVLTFCKLEKSTLITRPLIDQLIRSATSIGSNYAEANNAASKVDFRNKIFIAKKEAAESKYWLTLLLDLCHDKATCSLLLEENHYILMTFQKIINTMSYSKRITENAR